MTRANGALGRLLGEFIEHLLDESPYALLGPRRIAQQLTRAWGADFSAGTAKPLESDVPGVLAEPEVGPRT